MNILIIDENHLMRLAVAVTLMEMDSENIIHQTQTLNEGLSMMDSVALQLVILEVCFSGTIDIPGLMQLRQIQPQTPVLVYSGLDESMYAVPILKAGASGFLSKQVANGEFKIAVKTIIAGGKYLSSNLQNKLLENAPGLVNIRTKQVKLTSKERNVMRLIVAGKMNKEIAVLMDVKQNTISTYKKRIYEKLEVCNDVELAKKMPFLDLL